MVFWTRYLSKFSEMVGMLFLQLYSFFQRRIFLGKSLDRVPEGSVVFFPCLASKICCGLAGIVSVKGGKNASQDVDIGKMLDLLGRVDGHFLEHGKINSRPFEDWYLAGEHVVNSLLEGSRKLKTGASFCRIYFQQAIQEQIQELTYKISEIIEKETSQFDANMGFFSPEEVEIISGRIEKLKDTAWCLSREILENIKKVGQLIPQDAPPLSDRILLLYKQINAVLNSIERLEVRGRDSAGISLLFVLTESEYGVFEGSLKEFSADGGLFLEFKTRCRHQLLKNRVINVGRMLDGGGDAQVGITLTYKVAAEIGKLGDNIGFIRKQIFEDNILGCLSNCRYNHHTVTAHTRWASVGAINEVNCHPLDNLVGNGDRHEGIIHACLNGDIDNYLDLKNAYENRFGPIPEEITTDTKIIPLQIESYIKEGYPVTEAFRLAVNDFEGSHAICMHTNLAPGKLFLAHKGGGQAIFVGLADEHVMPASEIYGFIEETQEYIKLDGEREVQGKSGTTKGQLLVLSQESTGKLDGIQAMYYDGTPLELKESDIKTTALTSRDIDRQDYSHYFLKEISESPQSVEKTLLGRWKFSDAGRNLRTIALDRAIVPESLEEAFKADAIRRIFLIGQGTAGVAAQACGNILSHYFSDPSIQIIALKASELSGFGIGEAVDRQAMAGDLVIAISQSGTTTDTNRAVDMVKERGAHTLAIVNRRDSDITFKVDGVMYTSSGRDIEMSVASTKAFYSQIVAGAILGLYFALARGRCSEEFVSQEIERLLDIPGQMRTVLEMKEKIARSAKRLAVSKTYWAAVGSGPNKASADEIRIKLSELCYKTISSDWVEDKKHIDLSSEPLIIVCAAGTRNTVIQDLIKDTAIFKAHKACPVVIANEGETRFNPYAEDVFQVPAVAEHLAPILNTLVGHVWGYYAALAINETSGFLSGFREELRAMIEDMTLRGMDVYEVILEKSFREKVAEFAKTFSQIKTRNQLPIAIGIDNATDLTLLLKYLSGRLSVSDFEIDFGIKGTASNMLNLLFECLGKAINAMARPVDAIKHQAKTVTVGTSRITEKMESGVLFDTIWNCGFRISQLTPNNIIVLRNLQKIVEGIKGSMLYRIDGLNIMGELTDATTIEVVKKKGVLKMLPSRVESDHSLKGTKRIIVKQKNVYIGKGRKDNRSIIIIPINSSTRSRANMIEHLLLLNISFRETILLKDKIRALGGKYEHIKNIVHENSVAWEDNFLECIEVKDLFGLSAEKISEQIVSMKKNMASGLPANLSDSPHS
jgi:glucosamine--fructose-6-phosphate aminotransferase (isomerizing)